MQMSTYEIVNLFTREDVKRIKFLLAATSKDTARPVMNFIYLNEKTGQAVAADGFRMHLCNIPEALHEYTGKLIRPEGPVKRGRVIFEVQEQILEGFDKFVYPDYSSVLADHEANQALYEFTVTTELLKSTMGAFRDHVDGRLSHLVLAGPDQPYEIRSVDDQEFRAILAPAHGKDKAPEMNALYEALKETKAKLEAMERKDTKKRLAQLAQAGLDQAEFETLRADFAAWENRLIVLENQARDLTAAQKVTGEK